MASALLLDVGVSLLISRLGEWLALLFYGDGLTVLTLGLTILLTVAATGLASGFAAALLLADQAGDAAPRHGALTAASRAWPRLLLAALVLRLPDVLLLGARTAILEAPEMANFLGLLTLIGSLAGVILGVLYAPIFALAVDPRAHGRRFFGLAFGLARPHLWLLLGLYVVIILPVDVVSWFISWRARPTEPMAGILGYHPLVFASGVAAALARQFLALAYAAFYWERLEGGRRSVATADVFD